MNVTLKRLPLPDSTIGEISVDGKLICYSLEDRVRPEGEKVAGDTAIPFGTYEIVLDHSPRFDRVLPRLLDVPNFDGVRIHTGNFTRDTEGCILAGKSVGLFESRAGFDLLFNMMQGASERGEKITITIE